MEKINERIQEVSAFLKLIGDKTRLSILSYLKHREMCVCEFVNVFDLSQPAVSQHLKKLRTAGVICERKQGTWVYYRLNPDLPVYISDLIQTLPTLRIKECNCQTNENLVQLESSK
ncbi:ArsR/SmtB family transcription factor [Sporolactobacillus pectinivorans]|uniref:ArsR/SmtB family transcription factor n=1 Tax=Sporolactobacillus pectinivorans TaxID=1591408 RepID=UPI000C268E30|nr:metalloregulator ArsR/SmtB family transcription factor [Sporolactobacillus pectinivorans]